jgi:nitric oxide synthase oxygenase domain/subunit
MNHSLTINNHKDCRSNDEILHEAKNFIEQYYASIKRTNSLAHESRWNQIVKEVTERNTYTLKETELIFGAKLGWRNAPRCIGRIQWSKLQVLYFLRNSRIHIFFKDLNLILSLKISLTYQMKKS